MYIYIYLVYTVVGDYLNTMKTTFDFNVDLIKGVDSLRHKLGFSNPYIFETQWRKPLLFQTYII